jgi:hypothetical protein
MAEPMDKSTREYIDAHIKEHIQEGDKPKVAVARSYEEARQVGFDVPEQKSNKPSVLSRMFGFGKKKSKMAKVS